MSELLSLSLGLRAHWNGLRDLRLQPPPACNDSRDWSGWLRTRHIATAGDTVLREQCQRTFDTNIAQVRRFVLFNKDYLYGKSKILEVWATDYSSAQIAKLGPTTDGINQRIPVIYVRCSNVMQEAGLYRKILQFLIPKANHTGDRDTLFDKAVHALIRHGVEFVVMDDVQLLRSGPKHDAADAIRGCLELPATVVATGHSLAASPLLSDAHNTLNGTHLQLTERMDPLEIPSYETGPRQNNARFMKLVEEFATLFSQREGAQSPALDDGELLHDLSVRAAGRPSRVIDPLIRAGIMAYDSDSRLTRELLRKCLPGQFANPVRA